MIPKVIHYCWFGGNSLPDEAKKCIESWKKYCPDYDIKQWDESNFDINCCQYVKEAYEAKKWAFVSDYARFWILYRYGGLYFDTDVEMIKTIDDIVENGSFMGMEQVNVVDSSFYLAANPGLGLAANPCLELYREILDDYEKSSFYKFPGVQYDENVVGKVTRIIKKYGFDTERNNIQKVNDIIIYPSDYFAPMDYKTKVLNITKNTRTIHHYAATWINPIEIKINELNTISLKNNNKIIKKWIRLRIQLLKAQNRLEDLGFLGFVKYSIWILRRIRK